MSDSTEKKSEESEAKEANVAQVKAEDTPNVTSDSWQDNEPPTPEATSTGPVIAASVAAPTVTLDRKKELLLQARANRLAWVQAVPLPYQMMTDSSSSVEADDDYLSALKSTHAVQKLPSMSKVLTTLYGVDQNVASAPDVKGRIESVLDNMEFTQADRDLAFLTISQKLGEELSNGTIEEADRLKDYREFVTKLEQPECAGLIQGMRNFVFKVPAESADDLASSLRTYTESTFEVIKVHAAWREAVVDETVLHAFESFLCGQCRNKIKSVMVEETANDANLLERLDILQFLVPSHLEIDCISDADDSDTLLKEPIGALGSVARHFSPYARLQCILKVYHGINTALKQALNRDRMDGTKLPSADDVLPALILTVLRSRPSHLVSTLRMIEIFAPPDYLRGEAGYAFTNLYSAVQFIRDLKMDAPDSISISAEDFRQGLEEYRRSRESNLATTSKLSRACSDGQEEDTPSQRLPLDIPVNEIRAARLRGEIVDVDWALKWQLQRAAKSGELLPSGESTRQDGRDSERVSDGLPHRFSRTYSFLTSRPEDIHIADLPQLLKEYRMLVHTTEQLLAEQTTRRAFDRKERVSKQRKELLDAAAEIDPSLLRRSKRQSRMNK